MTSTTNRIGAFTLDLRRLCLLGPSGPVELRPKSFEVLTYFAQHPDRVISRDELLKVVWPNINVTDDSFDSLYQRDTQGVGVGWTGTHQDGPASGISDGINPDKSRCDS